MTSGQKAHYLRLYKAADEILKQPNNPCEIRMQDGKPSCTMSRNNPNQTLFKSPSLCCGGCKHLGPTGCTIAALGCKLGWCYTGQRALFGQKVADHPMFAAISAIRDEAERLIPNVMHTAWRNDPSATLTVATERHHD